LYVHIYLWVNYSPEIKKELLSSRAKNVVPEDK